MNARSAIGIFMIAVALALGGAACGLVDGPLFGRYGTRGTVTFLTFEGGFHGIVTADGERLDPINLPDEFRVDGLKVRFDYKPRTDLGSFHMWGTLVEIERIKKD